MEIEKELIDKLLARVTILINISCLFDLVAAPFDGIEAIGVRLTTQILFASADFRPLFSIAW